MLVDVPSCVYYVLGGTAEREGGAVGAHAFS